MKRICLLILMSGLLTGCGGNYQASSVVPELSVAEPSLWTARIGRGEREIFAGLLILRYDGSNIKALLLDSTGVIILEEDILPDGEVKVIRALPAVKNRRLPSFLGEGLHRLFFNSEGFLGDVCHSDGLARLCLGEKAGRLVKSRHFGPFVLWRAEYFINNYRSGPGIGGARLDSFWPAPFLDLRRKFEGDPSGESNGKTR